jgi:pyrophosphatase PpaX
MNLGGLIFDLDGTLTDTLPVALTAFHEAVRVYSGRSYTDEEIVARFGPTEEGMLQRLVPDRWEDCLHLYLRIYEQEHQRTGRIFPGIVTALDMLKARGIPLAVVTGKGPKSAAISLSQLGLASYFDFIETGSPEGSVKPQCIRRVLARWGIAPEQTAYLGDAVSDIEAARAVGLIPLAAAWEKRAEPKQLHSLAPAAIFHTVEEFFNWIADLEPLAPRSQRPVGGTQPLDHPS